MWKIPLFHSMWKIPLFHSMWKIPLFHSMWKIPLFHTFTEFRAFFQNFRVFKKFPDQSSSGIPHKNSVLSHKIPRLENYRRYKFRVFSQKIPCFTKFPGFYSFKSLKNTRKNHVFSYKKPVKSIYLSIKNIYKR